jgi:predicted SnoaL-like aldol condensation-catalyzing enzyme
MTAEHNMGLVRRVVEDVWNRSDLALADVLIAPGYVNHGGLIPDVLHGPEAIKVAVALYRTAFPTFHISVEALVAEGEMVELQWAAHRSPPTAQAGDARASPPGPLRGTTRSGLSDGQIVESWTSWDKVAVLHQRGIVPAEEAP